MQSFIGKRQRKKDMFKAVKTVIVENWENRKRMLRLANYESRAQNNGTVFGALWNILNPALQIFVYWFVFSVGLQVSAPREGYPYILWMIVGIMPWFYISSALQQGATSIYNYSGVLKKVYLPLAIVPVKTVFSGFITHLWSMIVVFVIIFASGYSVSSNVYEIVYYMFAIICFLIGWGLLASAITVLFKDFQKILSAFIRLLFYISPIVWDQSKLPDGMADVFKYNPLSYVLQGYRNCILYGISINEDIGSALYFWGITLALFLLGTSVHIKKKKKFMDLI